MRTSSLFSSLAILLHQICKVTAGTVARDLHIVNAELSPDGFQRSAVTAEGQFPGPLIFGFKGDTFKINVKDQLSDPSMHRSTSIHWHGLFQARKPEMDGVSFVNQCPIIPENSYLYDFSTGNQTGTYWYHSHLSTQYCDGLRGPLVIYDPLDPLQLLYDVDDASTVITLADWYHGLSTDLFPNPHKDSPVPDSTLINGKGRWSGSPTPSELAVVRATPGLRHRFRIISTSCYPSFTFSIDSHPLTIIEADGVETEPHTVDSIEIFSGQRYSIVLNANQSIDNYWIRAIPSVGNNSTSEGLNSAILRYDGAPDMEPTSSPSVGITKLNEADLSPQLNPGSPGQPFPGGADVNINLKIGFDKKSKNFTMNGVSFVPPSVPILLQILSGSTSPESIMPSGSVYRLPPNKVIEVSLPDSGSHPFHLHGHNFDVVRVAGSETYNYANPVRRDVVNTGSGHDNVTIRFVTDNPGPWFLHCHIDWHLEAGLAVAFAEDTEDVQTSDRPNEQWEDLCSEYNDNNPDGEFS